MSVHWPMGMLKETASLNGSNPQILKITDRDIGLISRCLMDAINDLEHCRHADQDRARRRARRLRNIRKYLLDYRRLRIREMPEEKTR